MVKQIRPLALVALLSSAPVAAAQSVIEIPLPSTIDTQRLWQQASSSGFAGENLEYLFQQLLDAARGVTGGVPPDTQLIVPFDVVSDGQQFQIQQHELTFRYTPTDPWITMLLQSYSESEAQWYASVFGVGGGGSLFLSYGIPAEAGTPTRWRFVIEQPGDSDVQLTYDLDLIRHSPVTITDEAAADVTLQNVRENRPPSRR